MNYLFIYRRVQSHLNKIDKKDYNVRPVEKAYFNKNCLQVI